VFGRLPRRSVGKGAVNSWLSFVQKTKIHFCPSLICAKLRIGITMPRQNSNQHKSKSKFADGFHVSSEAIVGQDNEQENDFGERVGLPRVHGAPILFAIARDPRTIFTYWSIDWPAVFAKTVPVDRQAHLRVYRADGVEEESVAVEPMSGNCSIAVSRPSGSYHVEIGYYQPADVWNSIATSNEVTMPRDSFANDGEVGLATIPFHLSFQRLLDLFGASKGHSLAEMISQFQKRVLNNEKSKQLSDKEREILRAMGLSLSEIAAARRAFIDHANTETLRKRTEALFGFASSSPARGFGESSWSSNTA
jgi:hypothetical protein